MLSTLLAAVTPLASAAVLSVSVVDQSAAPVADAVVYATPVVAAKTTKHPAPLEIAQVNKTFVPLVSAAQTGAAVSFPNRDTIRHQVYSFSQPKTFELKLYAGVPAAPVVFDKPGLVVLGCNIHDNMIAYLVVVDTPWFAKSDASGQARIEGLPPGDYLVKLWHPKLSSEVPAQAVKVSSDTAIKSVLELKSAT